MAPRASELMFLEEVPSMKAMVSMNPPVPPAQVAFMRCSSPPVR